MGPMIVSLNSSFKSRKLVFNDLAKRTPCGIYNLMDAKAKKTRDPDNVAIGKAIRRRRQYRKLKLAELGDLLGVSEGQMSKFETGENAVTYKQLALLAGYLKTTPEALCKDAARAPTPELIELQSLVSDLSLDQQRSLLGFLRGKQSDQA